MPRTEAKKEANLFEQIVNGHTVHFRERYPYKDSKKLVDLFTSAAESGGAGLDDSIALLPLCVESWDYEGDPSDPAVYDEMDLFEDIIPLVTALNAMLEEKMGNLRG